MLNKLINVTEKVIKKGWIENQYNGYGSGGITFEKEIGIITNNFEIPDYNGIEIKTKISSKEYHINLFCSSPDSFLFETKRIFETYGENKSFNISVYSHRKIYYKGKYYQLNIDDANKKIILMIYDNNKNLIDNKTSWSYQIIKEKINRKIKNLFIVYGERKYQNRQIYFKYNKYNYYEFKGFDAFISELKKGNVRVSFSIGTFKSGKRKGQMYDHGTSFNISRKNLEKIYYKKI